MISISSEILQIALHEPLDGFYKGTRFDRGGIFHSLLFNGTEMAGDWYPRYDPLMHDAVKGPAEEFSPLAPPPSPSFSGLSRESLIKIGVGLLSADLTTYDRFRLYEVLDPGDWNVQASETKVLFRHTLKGIYQYEKEIALTGEDSFRISHKLLSEIPLEGEVYNHNFFTMGRLAIGPTRKIDFPFRPEGDWRTEYDSAAFTNSGIRFSRELREGETVYAGNIHKAGSQGMPYEMTLRETPLSVSIKGDVPVTRTVMWSSHRVACLEPYNRFSSAPGKPFSWTITYRFQTGTQ